MNSARFSKSIQKPWKFNQTLYNFSNVKHLSGNIKPATDYFVWNTANPVKIRMENSEPGNYPPILVQTMFRNVVQNHRNQTAIVSHDGKIRWTYEEYQNQVENAAKGFISLGLNPLNGVGIMAQNSPQWFVSSLASIFAGGLSCGIYTTNSSATVKYISENAPLDLLVIQNDQLLKKIIRDEPKIQENVKNFILVEESISALNSIKNVLTWNDMMAAGADLSDDILQTREQEQAVNQACMLIYTSGTTGPPKGELIISKIN